jgi:hypothetical protein
MTEDEAVEAINKKLEDAYREGYSDCYETYLPILAAIVCMNGKELVVDMNVLKGEPQRPLMDFYADEPEPGKIRITFGDH